MLHIEKSTFRPGEYVGYMSGVWTITRSNSSFGNWCAKHRDDARRPPLFAFTLKALDAKFAEMSARESIPGPLGALHRACAKGEPIIEVPTPECVAERKERNATVTNF